MSYLPFCHWLISSDIMTLRFIHVVCVAEFPCFLRLNNLLCEYTTFCVFIHLLWAFGLLPHLAVMNNAALKGANVSLRSCFQSQKLGHVVVLFLTF